VNHEPILDAFEGPDLFAELHDRLRSTRSDGRQLLDEAGHETNNRQGYDWKALPGSVGRALTGSDGGFFCARAK
jgi:hypothetical protein